MAYVWIDQFYVNSQDAPIGRILASSGMDVISPATAAAAETDVLSLEQITTVADAEIIIAPDFLPEQTAVPAGHEFFRALPALQDGASMLFSLEMTQALNTEPALSLAWSVPHLVDAVIAGADRQGKRLE